MSRPHIYDGQGDELMVDRTAAERLVLVPDAPLSSDADRSARIRIMWGQHMLDDLVAGRYNSLVCAVNAEDNSRGLIGRLAELLPTSQWTGRSITEYAARFVTRDEVTVLKFDMDAVEVLALLRPAQHETLTLRDLSLGFQIVSEMLRRKTERLPTASVSFLGARVNRLFEDADQEPSFETVLRTMHEAGYTGDVYPAPWMWESAPTTVYARYPFPGSLEKMREGGY